MPKDCDFYKNFQEMRYVLLSNSYCNFCKLFILILFLDNSDAMKALIQRVTNASVTVNGEVISSIGKGLCVFIGVHRDDNETDLEYMVRKILNLRLFDNEDGTRKWSTNVVEKDYEILCVSQFTLCYSLKGNKADFHYAMGPAAAEPYYNQILSSLRSQYKEDKIKDGKFGAYMQVNIVNDGPVTMQLESPSSKN